MTEHARRVEALVVATAEYIVTGEHHDDKHCDCRQAVRDALAALEAELLHGR